MRVYFQVFPLDVGNSRKGTQKSPGEWIVKSAVETVGFQAALVIISYQSRSS